MLIGIILIILAMAIPWSDLLDYSIILLITAGILSYIYIRKPERLLRIFVNLEIRRDEYREYHLAKELKEKE